MSNPPIFDYTKDPKFQSQSKFKSDDCLKNLQTGDNKSIFDYVTDTSMFVNKSECFDSTPPFLSYLPRGIQAQDINIENDLRNSNRFTTKCNFKYQPVSTQVIENKWGLTTPNPIIKKECKPDVKIVPYGYINK